MFLWMRVSTYTLVTGCCTFLPPQPRGLLNCHLTFKAHALHSIPPSAYLWTLCLSLYLHLIKVTFFPPQRLTFLSSTGSVLYKELAPNQAWPFSPFLFFPPLHTQTRFTCWKKNPPLLCQYLLYKQINISHSSCYCQLWSAHSFWKLPLTQGWQHVRRAQLQEISYIAKRKRSRLLPGSQARAWHIYNGSFSLI